VVEVAEGDLVVVGLEDLGFVHPAHGTVRQERSRSVLIFAFICDRPMAGHGVSPNAPLALAVGTYAHIYLQSSSFLRMCAFITSCKDVRASTLMRSVPFPRNMLNGNG
jgi:hypothetical protein